MFNKLRCSFVKQWLLQSIWLQMKAHRALSITAVIFILLLIIMLVSTTAHLWILSNTGFLIFIALLINVIIAYRQFSLMNENN